MKLNALILIALITVSGCVSKDIKQKEIITEKKIEKKTENNLPGTGWADNDTYTVKVTAENIEKAKAKAKHQILLDIVKVRMTNESRFTEITKIDKEFEKPLKNGIVISEKNTGNAVEIFFQIKDQGLKQKFEKK